MLILLRKFNPSWNQSTTLGQPMKREVLFIALNETTHALRFAESAAKHFRTDTDELETASPTAVSVAFINNRLADAQNSLTAAEGEIGKLIQQGQNA